RPVAASAEPSQTAHSAPDKRVSTEALNWRRRPWTYKNGRLAFLFCSDLEEAINGRRVQATSRGAIGAARKPNRAIGKEPGPHCRRAETHLPSQPLAASTNVDLRAISAAPA